MATASEINTKADEAVALIEAGDYAGARSKLLAVKAILATRPDSAKADASLRWDRGAIDSLLDDLRDLARAATVASTGIVRSAVKYVRPGEA